MTILAILMEGTSRSFSGWQRDKRGMGGLQLSRKFISKYK